MSRFSRYLFGVAFAIAAIAPIAPAHALSMSSVLTLFDPVDSSSTAAKKPPKTARKTPSLPPAVVKPAPVEMADVVPAGDPFLSDYRLGPGDIISIQVLGEPELSSTRLRLTDNGTLSLPAVGEVVALGKTTGEVEQLMVSSLIGRILINPQVSVAVDEYRPFFINGMVEKPGGYPFQPGLNIRKAAALAGGFKERASMKKIFVIREADKTQTPIKVDLAAPVMPGDIVVIEESFF